MTKEELNEKVVGNSYEAIAIRILYDIAKHLEEIEDELNDIKHKMKGYNEN